MTLKLTCLEEWALLWSRCCQKVVTPYNWRLQFYVEEEHLDEHKIVNGQTSQQLVSFSVLVIFQFVFYFRQDHSVTLFLSGSSENIDGL